MSGINSAGKGIPPDSAETDLDTSLAVQTPEGIEYTLFPAGLAVRACAWGIDCLLMGIVLLGLIILTSAVMEIFGIWFYFLVSFALNWFYYVFFELVWNGQTPGKRIMGIRVVGGGGSPVTAGASFMRNLLRFADGFFYLYLIAFVCMIFSPGFRRIGDWAGDTLVVYTSRTRLRGRYAAGLRSSGPIPWLADFPPCTPAVKLEYEEKQALLMFAGRYPLLGKNRADEIAGPWAACLRTVSERDIPDSGYLLGIARLISGVS